MAVSLIIRLRDVIMGLMGILLGWSFKK